MSSLSLGYGWIVISSKCPAFPCEDRKTLRYASWVKDYHGIPATSQEYPGAFTIDWTSTGTEIANKSECGRTLPKCRPPTPISSWIIPCRQVPFHMLIVSAHVMGSFLRLTVFCNVEPIMDKYKTVITIKQSILEYWHVHERTWLMAIIWSSSVLQLLDLPFDFGDSVYVNMEMTTGGGFYWSSFTRAKIITP